jgi:hypothetical protein
VPCPTFASAVTAAAGQVDPVKADTEGAEHAILLVGGPEDWAGVDAVVMEYHGVARHSSGELAELFDRAGLRETAPAPAAPRQGTVRLGHAAP